MPMPIKINPNLEILPTIDYRLIDDIQDDLKEMSKDDYNRLRASLKESGLLTPFCIWLEPNTSKKYLLDGNQRKRLFNMENVQPYEIPYLLIPGETADEAKRNLLQISSQYGKITEKGLNNFIFNLEIPQDWLDTTITFAGLSKMPTEIEKPVTHLPKVIDIKPFTKTHVLISFPPERLIDIQDVIKTLSEYPDVEIEQASN